MRRKKNAQTQTLELTQMSSGVVKSHKKDNAYFQKLQRDMQAQIHRQGQKYIHFYNIWVHDLWS